MAKKTASSAKAPTKARPATEVEEEELEEGEEETEGASTAAVDDDFDYAGFLAENGIKVKAEDIHDVGGLTPIYASEYAAEEEWPPLFGLMLGFREIPVDKNDPDQGVRPFIIVEVKIPTKGLAGTGDDRHVVDIETGERVLMPVSGAIKNREELLMAVADPDTISQGLFRVTGRKIRMKERRKNDMWEVVSKLVGDAIPRKGRYAQISLSGGMRTKQLGEGDASTANGQTAALPPGTPVNKQGQPTRAVG